MAGDISREGAPLQHWQKATGLFGARGGQEGVGGATPGAGETIYGEKSLPQRKFLVEHREFWVPLELGLVGVVGRDLVLGREKPSPMAVGGPIWCRVPSGCLLPGCVLAATCMAPGALSQ